MSLFEVPGVQISTVLSWSLCCTVLGEGDDKQVSK